MHVGCLTYVSVLTTVREIPIYIYIYRIDWTGLVRDCLQSNAAAAHENAGVSDRF